MNIGFDIDDTITDTYSAMFGYAQKYTIDVLKRSAKLEKLNNLTNHFYIQALHNWTDDESEEFFKKYYKQIVEETTPFPYAVETIKKLKDEGHRIILITARWNIEGVSVKELTEKWLKEKQIPYDVLVVNASTKKEAAIQNNLDIFVDDSFENCKNVAEANIKTYIMDTRYNGGLDDERITRVYSWPHLEQEIRREIK